MQTDQDSGALPRAIRIPARSRRHAMDWSLVLASQGIEAVIDNDADYGWSLLVSEADHAPAQAAIKQYRLENLRWPWRRPVLQRRLLFDWGSTVWVLLAVIVYSLADTRPTLENLGMMDTTLFGSGQWWRAFTAIWLHGDPAHLAANVIFGFVLLGLAMGHYGTGIGLLAAYLAGVCGNLADWVVYPNDHHSLGASGMVMAALGLLAIQSLSLRRELNYPAKYIIGGIAAGVMLFTLFGLAPESDVIAHVGGFIGGLAVGALLSLFTRIAQNATVNLLAGLLFAALVILPWQRAIAAR